MPDAFIGKWKSDEALTLQDMNKYNVTDKARKVLEQGMFGRLVVIFRKGEGASYFEDEETPVFEPYEIVEVGDNSVTIKYYVDVLKDYMERTWYVEDNLLYTRTSKWNFKEYFRRVE